MRQKIVTTLICGNCLNAHPMCEGRTQPFVCTLTGVAVSKSSAFCRYFVADTSVFTKPQRRRNFERHVERMR